MMSLWSPRRDPHGRTRNDRGRKEEIRRFWLEESVAFQPTNHWISITPRTRSRSRSTVTGARCTSSATTSTPRPKRRAGHGRGHRRRADRRGVVGHQHGRGIDRADPEPLSEARAVKERRAAVVEERRPLSRGNDRLVRAVGRLPAKVHQAAHRVRGHRGAARRRRRARAARPRAIRRPRGEARAAPGTSRRVRKLQSDTAHVRLLLAENVDPDFYLVWPGAQPTGSGRDAVDKALVNELERIGPSTLPDRLGFVPPAEDESVLREIRVTSGRLSALMSEIIDSPGDGQRPERSASPSTSTNWPLCSPTRRRRRPTT